MDTPPPAKRRGKFAKLRDADKQARDRARAEPSAANRAVAQYMRDARVASILLSKMRNPDRN